MEQASRVIQEPPMFHQNAGHFKNYYLKNQAVSDDKLVSKGEKRRYRHPTVSEITDFYLKRSKDFPSIKDLYEEPIQKSNEEKEKEMQTVNKELQRTYQKIMQKLLSQGTLISSKTSVNPSSSPIRIKNKNLRQTQSLSVNEKTISDPRKIRSQNIYMKSKPNLKRNQSECVKMDINKKSSDNFKTISPVSSKNVFADCRKSMHTNLINISSNLSTMLQESCAGIDNICQKVRMCLLDASVSYQFRKAQLENHTLSLPVLDFPTKKDLNTIFETPRTYREPYNTSEISVIIEEQTIEDQNEDYAKAKRREIEKELDKKPHKETAQDKVNNTRSVKSITPFFTILKTKSSRSLNQSYKFNKYLAESMKEIEKINEFEDFLNSMVEGINNEITKCYIGCPGGPSNDKKKDDKNGESSKEGNKDNDKKKEKEEEEKDKDNDKQQTECPLQGLLQNEDHISESDIPANWTEQNRQRRHALVFKKTDFSIPDVYRKRAITNLHQRLVAQVEANDSFIFFQKLMKNSQKNSDGEKKHSKNSKTSVEKSIEKKQRSPTELLKKYENSLWFRQTKKLKKENDDMEVLRIAAKNDKKWQKLLPQSYSVKSSISLSQKSSTSRKSSSRKENKNDIRSLISLSRKSSKISKGSISNKSYQLQMTNDQPLSEADKCRLSWMRIKYAQMTKKNLRYMDILDDITKKDLVPLRAEYPRRNEELNPKPNIKNSLLYKLTHDKNQYTEDAWSILLPSTKRAANEEVEENVSQMTINDVDENVYDEDERKGKSVKVANVKRKQLEKLCNNLIKGVQESSNTATKKIQMDKARGDTPKKLTNLIFNSDEGVLKQQDIPKLNIRNFHTYHYDKIKDKPASVNCPEPNCKKCSHMTIDDVIYEEEGERARTPATSTSPTDPTKKNQNENANGDIAKTLSKFIFNSDEDVINHQSQKVYTVMPAHVIYTNPPLLNMRKKNESPAVMLPLQPMKEAKEALRRGEWTDGHKQAPKQMKVIYNPVSKAPAKDDRLSARQITAMSNTQMKIAQINSWSPKNFSQYCATSAQVPGKPVLRKNIPSIVRKNSPSIQQTSKTGPVSPELFEIFKKASNAVAGLKKATPKMHQGIKTQESTTRDGVSNGERLRKAPSPPRLMFDMDLIPKRDSKVDAQAKKELEKLLQEDSLTRSKSPKEKKIWERKFGKTTGQKLINFVENQPDKYEIPTPKYAQPKIMTVPNPTISKVAKQQEMLNQLKSLKTKNCNVQINIEKAIDVIEDKMVDILSKPATTDSLEAFDEMEKEITCILNSMKTKKSKKSSKHDIIKEPVKEEEEDIADQLIKRLTEILDTSSMSSLKDAKLKQPEKFPRKPKSNVTKRSKESKNKIPGSVSTSNEKLIDTTAVSPRKREKTIADQIIDSHVKNTTSSLKKSVPPTPKTPITAVEKIQANNSANREDTNDKNQEETPTPQKKSYETIPDINQEKTPLINQEKTPTQQKKIYDTIPDIYQSAINTIPLLNSLVQIQQTPKSIYQAPNSPPETTVNLALIERLSPQDLSPGGDQVSDIKSLEDEEITISNGVMGDQGDQVAEKEGSWISDEHEDKNNNDIANIVNEEGQEEEQENPEASIQQNQEVTKYSDSTYVTLSEGPTKSCATMYCTPQWSPVTLKRGQNENIVKEEIKKIKASEVVSDEEINKIGKIQQEINNCILNLEESMAIGEKVVEETSNSNINKNEEISNTKEVARQFNKSKNSKISNKLKEPQNSIKYMEDLPYTNTKEYSVTEKPLKIQSTQSRKLLIELDEMTEESTPSFYDHVNKIISRVENVYSQLEEFEGELQSDFSESLRTSTSEKSKISVFNQHQRDAEIKSDILVTPYMQAMKDLKVVNQTRPETPKTPKAKCQRSPSFYNVLNFLDTLTDIRESHTAIEIRTVRFLECPQQKNIGKSKMVGNVTKTAKLTERFLLWTYRNLRLVYFARVIHYPVTFYQTCMQYFAQYIPPSIFPLSRKPTKSCLKKTPSQDRSIRIIDFRKDKERLDKIKRQQKKESYIEEQPVRRPKVSFHIMQEEKSTQVTICPYHSAQAMKILSQHQLELMLDKPPPKKDMQVTATLDTVEDKSVDAILEAHDDSTFENTDSMLEKTDDAILDSFNDKNTSNQATNGSDTDGQLSNDPQDFFQELGECSTSPKKHEPAKVKESVQGEIKVFYDYYQDSSSGEKKTNNTIDSQVTKVEGTYDEDTIDQVKHTLSKEKDLAVRKKSSLDKIQNQNIQDAIVSEVYRAAQLLEPLKNLSEFIDSKLLKEAIEARQKLRMLTRKTSTDLLKKIKRQKSTESLSLKCSRSTMTTRQEGLIKGIYVFVYLVVFTALNMDYKCLLDN